MGFEASVGFEALAGDEAERAPRSGSVMKRRDMLVGGAQLASITVGADAIAEFAEDETGLLVAGEVGGRFEDVVKGGPDAVGFFAHGKGKDFHEQEEGDLVLLDGTAVPSPGCGGGQRFEGDGGLEGLGA